MVSAIAVRAAAYHLPDRLVPVAELPGVGTLGEAEREVCANLGIDEIHAGELTAFDLAAEAARRLLAETGLPWDGIGGLIMIEPRAPETLMSSEPTRLQATLGASRAVTFSVGGLGCVSITPALLAARGLLAADGDLDNILVAHGSTPATPMRYRHPVTVSGDGGMAVVISRQGPVRILDILQETNGEYWDLFQVDYRDRPLAGWREQCRDLRDYSFRLAVEGRNRMRELHARLLDRNGMRPADVSRYLSHNLSVGAFRFTEEALGVEIGKACFDNLRRYGHLGPIDVLLNLHSEIERGGLVAGQRAVLINASPVAAWSLVLVEIDAAA